MSNIWISCDYGVFDSVDGEYTLIDEGIKLKLLDGDIFIPMSKISMVGNTTKYYLDSDTGVDCYEIFLKLTEHEWDNLCALMYYSANEAEPVRR